MRFYIFLLTVVNIYMFLNLIFGKHSLVEISKINLINRQTTDKIIQIENENQILQTKIKLLDPKNLNTDYLEFLSKHKLNYTTQNEYIILERDIITQSHED